MARNASGRQDLGGWRGLYPGGLRRRALAVLWRLDAPHRRIVSGAARLSGAAACASVVRAGRGRSAAGPRAGRRVTRYRRPCPTPSGRWDSSVPR
jgi:hypothetical protein